MTTGARRRAQLMSKAERHPIEKIGPTARANELEIENKKQLVLPC
jgi:hypothetical protein